MPSVVSQPLALASLTPESIRSVVITFLARYVDDPDELERERLLTGGILDSLAAVGLIAYLERKFDVTVVDEDLEIDNFDSLGAIVDFIGRKLCL